MPLGTENIGTFLFIHVIYGAHCAPLRILYGVLIYEVCCAPLRVLLCVFVVMLVYGVCCAPLRIFYDVSCLWSMLCSDTGFMRKSLLSFLKLIFLYYHYIFHQIVILEVGFRLFPLLLCNLAFYNFV